MTDIIVSTFIFFLIVLYNLKGTKITKTISIRKSRIVELFSIDSYISFTHKKIKNRRKKKINKTNGKLKKKDSIELLEVYSEKN